MKLKLTIFFILAFTITGHSLAQERMISMGDSIPPIPYSQFVEKNIIIMDITTVNGEFPTCDYIDSPPNGWGKSITNNFKVPGRMKISWGENLLYDSGDYAEGISGMTIRIRGNSSAYAPAKPYKIDLQKKADLLFRNNPSYNDKDWVLIRDIYQNAMIGYETCTLLGMQWTPSYGYVSLILNDEYMGLYMLVESVKRNTNCRINITKQGFLFEYDSYWWTQDYHIPSALYNMMRYTVKYPDPLTASDKQYLEQRISEYETSVLNGTYDQQIDVPSLAKWCLGLDILGINDAAGANRFLTLYDRNSKIVVPTMWDFDSAEKYGDIWSRTHRVLMKQFFENQNISFRRQFVEEWEQISETFVTDLNTVLLRYRNSDKGLALFNACDFENIRWNHANNFRSNIIDHIEWLGKRKRWIDKRIQDYYLTGDANRDWIVDVEDINIMINMILGLMPTNLKQADVNGDKIVDVEDVNIVINKILKLQ
ncbi:MAG: CotH kinase family protein [Muribaculaceae bacterium]|nr:CotH kinase family protein [Muribaculaceae bacterium]